MWTYKANKNGKYKIWEWCKVSVKGVVKMWTAVVNFNVYFQFQLKNELNHAVVSFLFIHRGCKDTWIKTKIGLIEW